MRLKMRNCWSYAIKEFESKEGWLLIRLTRRSSASPYVGLSWLGRFFLIIGVFLINWGFLFRTGRWLHVYHGVSTKGPFTSFEPDVGLHLKTPPISFKGHISQTDKLS